MLLEERLEMTFERTQLREPLICTMAKQFPDVLFNISQLSVGPHEARMTISLIGEVPQLRAVREHFESLGVELRVVQELKYKGTIPQVPNRIAMPTANSKPVEKRIWMTIVGALKSQHFLWTISRRYDVTYRITQSVTGDPVSIVSLELQGSAAEVDGVIAYLREQGINVDIGTMVSVTPFAGAS